MAFSRIAGAVGLLVCLGGAAVAAAPARFVPGTYRQIDTVTNKALPVGNQIVIIAGKAGKLGFSVNAVRQADLNGGFVAGLLPAALPGTWTKRSPAGDCKLTFEDVAAGLKVTQDSAFGDCGFGYGVSASGIYRLVPERPPRT